jgi:hypothetical protein
MNTTSSDLYPMAVNPSNFTRGDSVKKIYTDKITTPYVGVVTAVIPSTNKVEVQWPWGIGLEDPWDLIKVNPLIHPPVVKEDKSYSTYQSQKAQKYNEDYCKKLDHYSVLNDFLNENISPVMFRISEMYNKGLSKKDAFIASKKISDNFHIVSSVIDKIYSDRVDLKIEKELFINENKKIARVSLQGDSDKGFFVEYSLANNSESQHFLSYQKAFKTYNDYKNILANLESNVDYKKIVESVSEKIKMASSKEHVDRIKSEDLDIILNKLMIDLQE